jgi:hypothetical protein
MIELAFGGNTIEFPNHVAAPHLTLDAEYVAERDQWTDAVMVDVKTNDGKIGRFFVNVRIKDGRPVCSIHTKPNKVEDKQVSKRVTGTFKVLK